MGKAKSDPNSLQFKCSKCQSPIKVPIKFAGRYIDCPKCGKKTPVPSSQEEADDELKEYSVSQHAFKVPTHCTHCGAKMPKKAVLCTECGFDYRAGRQLDSKVEAPLPGEPVRGGLARNFLVGEIAFLLTFAGAFVYRGPMQESPNWWEVGLYLGAMAFMLVLAPKHFLIWNDYRRFPIRETTLRLEEDRAERQETTEPYGRLTILLFLLTIGAGVGIGYLLFGTDS